MLNIRHIMTVTVSVLALSFAATASAQDQMAGEEDQEVNGRADIIVTATRRDSSILDTPVSITAYTQEDLDLQGIRNVEDIARMTPGVSLNQGTFGINYLVIRGLTSSIGATMNGVYIDDTPVQVRSVSLTSNFYPAMFDLERVEVLRGPQGTLFGAGAMGGAIRFISAKPGLTDYSGYGRAEVATTEGGAPSYEGGAAVGGPIVDGKIGFRASGYYRRDGGYIDRVPYVANRGTPEKNANSRDTYVGNFALTIQPTDDISITPSIFFQQSNRNDSDQFWDVRPDVAPGIAAPELPPFTSGEGIASFGDDQSIIYSVKAEVDMGPATLITNTAFVDRKVNSRNDGTAFFKDLFAQPQIGGFFETAFGTDFRSVINVDMTQRAFTQELRLQSNPGNGPVRYVAGLFFQNSRQTAEEFDTSTSPLGIFPFIPSINGNIGYLLDETKDRQFAVFGQIDYQLTDKLNVSAGLRYSYLTFDFRQGAGNKLPTDAINIGRTSENPVTPKFGVEYTPSDDLLIYASAGKGFRPGGTNSMPAPGSLSPACLVELQALGYSEVPRQYRSDSTWSYEVGAKGRVGSWLTFAADIFQIDWSDQQRSRNVLNCGNPFIDNLGKSRARGVEAKITLTPARGLTLDANFSYTDATVRQTLIRPETVIPGIPGVTPDTTFEEDQIVTKGDRFAPPWIISLTADYETALGGSDLKGYGHLQWDYRSGQDAPTGNIGFNPLYSRVFTREFVSARLGARTGGVDISVFVNNLLNSKDELGRLALGGVGATRLLRQVYRPRTFGLTASYRF